MSNSWNFLCLHACTTKPSLIEQAAHVAQILLVGWKGTVLSRSGGMCCSLELAHFRQCVVCAALCNM